MFFTELTPILKELTQQPLTFAGGLVSGFLRLNPNEDPLKSWLQQQGTTDRGVTTGKSDRAPQSIEIE